MKNYMGLTFGRLTVIGKSEKGHICRCKCGCIKTISLSNLKATNSCGCLKREQSRIQRPSKVQIGDRYARLLVISKGYCKNKRTLFECQCDCGKKKYASSGALRNGRVKSCGCLRAENCYKSQKIMHELHALPSGRSAYNRLKRTYIKNAKERKLPFSLSDQEFKALTSAICHYCKEPPKQKVYEKSGTYVYNGIDRMDNEKGYTKENSVSCCKRCNRAKGAYSYSDFISWIRRIEQAHRARSNEDCTGITVPSGSSTSIQPEPLADCPLTTPRIPARE